VASNYTLYQFHKPFIHDYNQNVGYVTWAWAAICTVMCIFAICLNVSWVEFVSYYLLSSYT